MGRFGKRPDKFTLCIEEANNNNKRALVTSPGRIRIEVERKDQVLTNKMKSIVESHVAENRKE